VLIYFIPYERRAPVYGGIGAASLQACAEFTFAYIRNLESGAMQKLTFSLIAFAHGLHDENLSKAHSNRSQAKITTCSDCQVHYAW
jgi:hypothetical protein